MKPAFTPGPWHVGSSEQFGSGNWRIVTADNGETNICACHGTILTDNPEHPTNQTRDANARLIAASPELLHALQLMLIADNAICENIGRKSDQAMQRIAAIDFAREVLARIEGKEQKP